MNLPDDYVLKPGQRADPILWRSLIPLPPAGYFLAPADVIAMVTGVFGPGTDRRLQTWARDPKDPGGAHWISTRKGIGLHVDPKYPRYTHQLVVHNDGWDVRGVTGGHSDEPFRMGTLFCCDTHSPHQVVKDDRLGSGLYYVGCSVDSDVELTAETATRRILRFLKALEATPKPESH